MARFGTHEAQVAHRDELQARLRREFAARTTAEAVEALEAVDILRVKVNTLAEVLADPQGAHNQIVMEMHHPMVGRIRTVGIPVKMSETPGSLRLPPPRLGEHTREVLEEIGFSAEEIEALAGDSPAPSQTQRSR